MITCGYLQWPTINDDIALLYVVCYQSKNERLNVGDLIGATL